MTNEEQLNKITYEQFVKFTQRIIDKITNVVNDVEICRKCNNKKCKKCPVYRIRRILDLQE